MREEMLKKEFKLVWRANFSAITGSRTCMAQLETLHPSYRFLFAFYLLNPKQLTKRLSKRLFGSFFKQQGEDLMQQLEAYLPPPVTASRIQVRDTMGLLDFFLTIKESKLIDPITNARLAALIVSIFKIGLSETTIINYLSRNRTDKQ